MKEQVQLLAEYNRRTNEEMEQVLRGVPAEALARDLGSYYHSIMGILGHVALSDVNWLRRFAAQFPALGFITPGLPEAEIRSMSDAGSVGLAGFTGLRATLDRLLAKTYETFREEELSAVLHFTDAKGVTQSKVIWLVALHHFNHATHHRGQVSVMLDQLKIDNDYSGLLWKF